MFEFLRGVGRLRLLAVALLVASVGLVLAVATHSNQSEVASAATTDLKANPDLPDASGYDVVLVFDGSNSVTNAQFEQQRAGFLALVQEFFSMTNSEFAIVEYATDAVVRHGFTPNKQTIADVINAPRTRPGPTEPVTANFYTNWDAGLWVARTLFPTSRPDYPDLIVFASSGNPNQRGDHSDLGHLHDFVDPIGNIDLVYHHEGQKWALEEANAARNSGICFTSIALLGDKWLTAEDADRLLSITGPAAFFAFDFWNMASGVQALGVETFFALCGSGFLPTPSPTNTPIPTNTPTFTPTLTPTPRPTDTPTSTPTNTPTETPVGTDTPTPTGTLTETPTATPTLEGTPTETPTATPTFFIETSPTVVDSCSVAILGDVNADRVVTATEALLGDVNGDGVVTATDALLILRAIADKVTLICPDNADVDGDGDIDGTDALLILQLTTGLIDVLPGTALGLSDGAGLMSLIGGQIVLIAGLGTGLFTLGVWRSRQRRLGW